MTTQSISHEGYPPLTWPYTVPEGALVLHVTFQGRVLGKQRPRFTRKGEVYTPNQTKEYEATLRTLMRQALGPRVPDGEKRFALRCFFYRPSRQKIDCDNLLKAVSDAATGYVWVDDAQVVEVIGRLFLASDNPRGEIVIYEVPDPSPRTTCPTCGKPVLTYPSQNTVHCSIECFNKPKRVTLTCRWCKETYEIPRSQAQDAKGFCSRRCSMRFYGALKTAKQGPPNWKCEDCGKGVSRKEYKNCRGCSMKRRGDPESNYWKLRHATTGEP